jgi:tRNA G18 (ribose-2'-O)-methylase SpoU
MTPALREAARRMVSIPMDGMVDSLNVAVATGILLFAFSEKR